MRWVCGRRGLLVAFGVVVLVTLCSIPAVHQAASEPSPDLCGTLAQIGATLLVAFAIESGGFVTRLGRRGRNQSA